MKRKSRIVWMSVLLTLLACVVIVAMINEFRDRNALKYQVRPVATIDSLRAFREREAKLQAAIEANWKANAEANAIAKAEIDAWNAANAWRDARP
jgi:hypothetical protein